MSAERAPMRVLYVLPVGELGGAERAVETWAAAHTPRVSPLVVMPPGPLLQRFRALGVPAHAPPMLRISRLPGAIAFLRRLIRDERIDLVHSTMGKGHLFGGLGALAAGRPELWFSHGPIAPKRWQGLIPLIPSSTVLVNSRHMQSLQAASACNARSVRIVPLGVDTTRLAPDPVARRAMRAHFGLDDGALVIGFFGRIVEWKGQHVFLRALAAARDALPRDVRVFVVGGHPFGLGIEYARGLEALVASTGLGDIVRFVGHVDAVHDYYDLVDVVVHASTVPEPFGLVVAEAMAKARVVVATAEGGPGETIDDGVTGFLAPCGNVEDLAAALRRVAAMEPHVRADVGAAARRTIVARHDVAVSVRALEDCYAEILAG